MWSVFAFIRVGIHKVMLEGPRRSSGLPSNGAICHLSHGGLHGGAIVNMLADMWGGLPGMGHSGAARGGVLLLTETAACEWGHAGVRVNAVAPGWIASSGMDSYGGLTKTLIPKLKNHVPLRRLARTAAKLAAVEDAGRTIDAVLQAAQELSGMGSSMLVLEAEWSDGQRRHSAGPLHEALDAMTAAELTHLSEVLEPLTSCYTAGEATGRTVTASATLRDVPEAVPQKESTTLQWSLRMPDLSPAGYTAELFYP